MEKSTNHLNKYMLSINAIHELPIASTLFCKMVVIELFK